VRGRKRASSLETLSKSHRYLAIEEVGRAFGRLIRQLTIVIVKMMTIIIICVISLGAQINFFLQPTMTRSIQNRQVSTAHRK